MKWVMIRDGIQRFVEDSDPRPAIKSTKKKLGSFFTPYSPPWKQWEAPMLHQDSKNQTSAGDKFHEVREHELRTDPKARKWEESRKERVAKDKPAWVKYMKQRGEL
jgi:hypothetical protein